MSNYVQIVQKCPIMSEMSYVEITRAFIHIESFNLVFFQDHPATECFDLKIKENFHGRNKSEITINSCFKWTLTSESAVSGMAMLVIDIPSGYKMEQPTADQIVKSGQVPEMRDADVLKSGKTIWYFDHIPNVTRCFQHTVS